LRGNQFSLKLTHRTFSPLFAGLLTGLLLFSFFCNIGRSEVANVTPLATQHFDFSQELFGSIFTLSVGVTSLNQMSGQVTLNGGDTQRPTIPFTWDWGDGSVSQGWFPQTHTYADTTKNYVVTVTSHYSQGTTASSEVLVRFTSPSITPVSLPSNVTVSIPNQAVTLTSRMYSIPTSLTYFDDSFFTLINRSTVAYVLSAAASIQYDFVNNNVYSINGSFNQVLLRDPTFSGMYSLWYTNPVSFGAGDSYFQGSIGWSSCFHEMGHDFTLNTPANYYYGGKIDGNANALYSEAMAQIFQHATAYSLINNATTYGLSDDLVFEIEQSAIQSMQIVRNSYDDYVSSGCHYTSWNNPATTTDETFDTFMTIAYEFFAHAENSGAGYQIPLKRMMTFLQTFGPSDALNYSQNQDTPAAETFRSTFMVAALSWAFGQDLRSEFQNLNFPINDQTYAELVNRVTQSPLPTPSTTPTPLPSPTPTASSSSPNNPTSNPTASSSNQLPQSTSTSTPAPAVSSTPSVPEFPTSLILPVMIALITLAVGYTITQNSKKSRHYKGKISPKAAN